jgi:hypothetical protein
MTESLMNAANAVGSVKFTGHGNTVPASLAGTNKNSSLSNEEVREKYTERNPRCTIKLIAQPRSYGAKASSGKSMAKSAIRLAIDTLVKQPVQVEENTANKCRAKTVTASLSCSSEEAVDLLNSFENSYGGRMTPSIQTKSQAYANAKAQALKDLNITVGDHNKPIFASDEQGKAYFDAVKDFAYTGWEVYMSVKPDNVRATRSRSLRTGSLEEVRDLLPGLEFK